MEPTDFERGFRAVGVLDTLKLTAEFLASVRGRRKAVLFFSEGIDYPITDSFGGHSATDVIRATQDAITAAARANVNFYTIDPRGPGRHDQRVHGDGGQRLARDGRRARDAHAGHQRGHHRRPGTRAGRSTRRRS